MGKKTPVQLVKERYGSKEELAKLLYKRLESPFADESADDFQRRIRTTSNKKLLRLMATHETVEKEFGGKSGLIDAIMALHQPQGKPDLVYRAKLETYRLTRLLDLQRSLAKRARASV